MCAIFARTNDCEWWHNAPVPASVEAIPRRRMRCNLSPVRCTDAPCNLCALLGKLGIGGQLGYCIDLATRLKALSPRGFSCQLLCEARRRGRHPRATAG